MIVANSIGPGSIDRVHIGHVPFLKEHVSIVPHEKITTHKHYYSYSITGCEIGWHSPDLISERLSRLSYILDQEISNCIYESKFCDIYELDEILETRIEDLPTTGQDPINRIQGWGRNL